MNKPSCLIRVPSSLDGGTFFHWWIRFLNPFHDLTAREMDVAAALFQHRYELSKTVADQTLLDRIAIDSDARRLLEKKLQLSRGYMNVIFNKLRRCSIIVNDRLNPKFVPNISTDQNGPSFSVLILFDFKEDERKKAQV